MSRRDLGVVAQVKLALRAPAALLLGGLLGAFVPVATFWTAHHELSSAWSLQGALVLGGLLYSAKTVWQWGCKAFSCPYKATGFVVLLEGVMVLSVTPWLAYAALGYLVAINALATGCTLAARARQAWRNPLIPRAAAACEARRMQSRASPNRKRGKDAARATCSSSR